MKELRPSSKKILKPYILITIAGLFAFAPVSFMLRSLKNDIIALEYPINQFMSQCLHNGEFPYWFNTWGMGFPLQSNLTWGIFSTPQMLFCSIFHYNIYILHIEFIFFVLLSGWSMFYLLNKYIVKDKSIAQLLAICYMLSGFMAGSTQWLLYITAAAFIPLVISSLLKLLYSPTLKNALQFGIVYSMMFTSVYAAFNIITTYSLAVFILLWLMRSGYKNNFKLIKYLGLAAFTTAVLCLPCLYFTTELLKNIDRGAAITSDSTFFNSNYLHPSALSSMLFPFSSVKMNFSNTEGTMLDTYAGLFTLILLPATILLMIKVRSRSTILLFVSTILFLLISFGESTPLRNFLNLLPGFSYFRNPAIFRFYFLLSLFLFIAVVFKNKSFNDLFNYKTNSSAKIILYTTWMFLALCVLVLILNINGFENLFSKSLNNLIKDITFSQTVIISTAVQLMILSLVLILIRIKKIEFAKLLFAGDLIINTLICTPFFSVSNYSIKEVSAILNSVDGFPVQNEKPAMSAATYTDSRNNVWNNVNIFSKKISTGETYRGPLTLNNYYSEFQDSSIQKKWLTSNFIFVENNLATVRVTMEKPRHIQAIIESKTPTRLFVMQNYYPGWKAFYNGRQVEISKNKGMSILVPYGTGTVDFKYERKEVWMSALLLHLITIGFILTKIFYFFRRRFISSSLS